MPFWFTDDRRTIWDGRILSILRIMTGLLFMQHGGQKLLGWFGGMPQGMTVSPFTQIWFAGVLELVGGLLIAIGLFTRPVAFLLCGEMAVAYFQAHFPRSPIPLVNQGELAVLYCFVFLYLAVRGAGPWSVDAMMGRDRVVTATDGVPRTAP
ncbi:MAG TPA: DoxX family protein [Gemmatimonadaceae bacterium]|nr:DoxX family protein [Gemmatimonadaceae bacterium]